MRKIENLSDKSWINLLRYKDMKVYETQKYSLVWDQEKGIARSVLFDGFCFDSAIQLKKEALDMAQNIKALGVAKALVLTDIRNLSEEYRLDIRTRAILLDAMESVDKMAFVIARRPNILQILTDFLDAVNFVVRGRRMAYFETEEKAEEWLLK